jgi:uncharacterized protein YcbX
MSDLILSGLYSYPVKSLAGIQLPRSELDRYGLRFDRRWMLVDQEGEFLSQRRFPRMALIGQRIVGEELVLYADARRELRLPLEPDSGGWIEVRVWGENCKAEHCGEVADAWLSDFLGQPCRLVFMPESVSRRVDPDYAVATDRTAFSDGFPLLLLSEASLADLNSRLELPLSMRRFRPNLVVAGCEPYAEDTWRRLRIGDMTFRVVKPCARCIITTIDPTTAERGSEPLQTLSRYRRWGNKVHFGQNLLHDGSGRLAVGMRVEVLESSEA